MAAFDLESILRESEEHRERYAQLVNDRFYRLLRALGFDRKFVRGDGAILFDETGVRHIDAIGGYAALSIGREHPVLLAALREALDLKIPALVQFEANPLAIALAERLLIATGRTNDRVFFTNSGTEGVEAALKFARCATGHDGFICCEDSFHGLTLGALSVNGTPSLRKGFGPLLNNVRIIPFGDSEALARALEAAPAAGFILEPVQGKTLRVASTTYLQEVAAICATHRTLFIADEVQTGLGRTGAMLATDHAGVEPDIVVLSKALSGGLVPVGAVVARAWILEQVFDSMSRSVVHSSTFKEGPLAMVAGLASLHIIETEDLCSRAQRLGNRLRQRLESIPAIKSVRGAGLMLGIELDVDRLSGSLPIPFGGVSRETLVAQAVVRHLLREHHVLALATSGHTATIKFTPPLVIEESDIDAIAYAVAATIESLLANTLGAEWHGLAGMASGLLGMDEHQ